MVVATDPSAVLEYAQKYATASLSDPMIVGIDIDDFVAVLAGWQRSKKGSETVKSLLDAVIRNVKVANHNMRFGITLYEDDLSSRLLQSDTLSAFARGAVDRVSLYLHYRANAPKYAQYVEEVSHLFPNANIVAGVYVYDRLDYLPCAQGSRAKCTGEEEMILFRQALDMQLDLLRKGKLAGLEFYPGYFGHVQDWQGWGNARVCSIDRQRQCIDRTLQMQSDLLAVLHRNLVIGRM